MNVPAGQMPQGFFARLKSWVEDASRRPYALVLLFVLAFIEASLLPVPPDILFIALAVAAPRRSLAFASVCVAGSFAGAFVGYGIGSMLFDSVGHMLLGVVGFESNTLLLEYQRNVWPTLLLAGFTSIPFSVFTIAAGFRQTVDLATFGAAVLAGRMLRFYLLGIVFFAVGPTMKMWLEKYFARVTFAAAVVFIAALVGARWLMG